MRTFGAIYPLPLEGGGADLAPRLNMRLDLWSLRIRRLASIRRHPADAPHELAWWPWTRSDERRTR